jgi:hypothetical protein
VLGFGVGLWKNPIYGASVAEPQIRLSGPHTATDTSVAGTLIGTLSVVGGSGVYTFTEDDDPNELFQVDGNDLEQDGTFDAGVYDPTTTVTISADNGVDPPILQQFTITLLEAADPGDAPTMDFSIAANSQLIAVLADF